MDNKYLEVDFEKYCPTCKYHEQDEKFDPCNDCLQNGMNLHTHKPTEWKEP